MISTRWLIALFMAFTGLAAASDDIPLCCLCDGCAPPAKGRFEIMTKEGKSCNKLMLELADPSKTQKNSGICRAKIARNRRQCCDASYRPTFYAPPPTSSPGDSYKPGEHPRCNLCHDASYPKKDKTITAVLGMSGNPTCKDLYWMGLKGQISAQMCNPLQDYMDSPCGCWWKNKPPKQEEEEVGFGAPQNGDPQQVGNLVPKKEIPSGLDRAKSSIYDRFNKGRGNLHRKLKGGNLRR